MVVRRGGIYQSSRIHGLIFHPHFFTYPLIEKGEMYLLLLALHLLGLALRFFF